jgi:hypothetical protein
VLLLYVVTSELTDPDVLLLYIVTSELTDPVMLLLYVVNSELVTMHSSNTTGSVSSEVTTY